MEFYRLLPLDFKKFIRPKTKLIKEELYKLLYKEYYNFINVFLKKGIDMLPLYWLNDHAINLEKGKTPPYRRPYPMSKDKLLVIKKYINKHLNKGFINSSSSPTAAPILLAKKPKRGIQFYINYRGLNVIIIKN